MPTLTACQKHSCICSIVARDHRAVRVSSVTVQCRACRTRPIANHKPNPAAQNVITNSGIKPNKSSKVPPTTGIKVAMPKTVFVKPIYNVRSSGGARFNKYVGKEIFAAVRPTPYTRKIRLNATATEPACPNHPNSNAKSGITGVAEAAINKTQFNLRRSLRYDNTIVENSALNVVAAIYKPTIASGAPNCRVA